MLFYIVASALGHKALSYTPGHDTMKWNDQLSSSTTFSAFAAARNSDSYLKYYLYGGWVTGEKKSHHWDWTESTDGWQHKHTHYATQSVTFHMFLCSFI